MNEQAKTDIIILMTKFGEMKMKKILKDRKSVIYAVIALLAAVSMVINLSARFSSEMHNRTAEFVIDYKELQELEKQSGRSIDYYLEEFGKIGFSKVSIEQESIASLIESGKPLEKIIVSEMTTNLDELESMPAIIKSETKSGKIDKYDVILRTSDENVYSFIKNSLEKFYSEDLYRFYEEGSDKYIVLDGTIDDVLLENAATMYDNDNNIISQDPVIKDSKLSYVGLGFDEEKIKRIKDSGMKVLARPLNNTSNPDKLVSGYMDELEKNDIPQDYILFAGSSILGYDGDDDSSLSKTASEMKSKNSALGLIEAYAEVSYVKSLGIETLASKLDYDIVRVLPITRYMQKKYNTLGYAGSEEIQNVIYRGIVERGVRSVFFRPFIDSDNKYVTDMNEYKEMMDSVSRRLKTHAISIGDASRYEIVKTNNLTNSLIGLGVVGAATALLGMLFGMKKKTEYMILAVAAVGCFGAFFVSPYYAKLLAALASAIVYPALAALFVTEFIRKRFNSSDKFNFSKFTLESVIVLFVSVMIALIGGLSIGSILTDMKFIAKMDAFRGVKIGQLLALSSAVLVYMVKFGFKSSENRDKAPISSFFGTIGKLLDESIRVKHLVAGIAVLAVGYVYISRTGNESSIAPSLIEIQVRNFMEYALVARPRTKEFLMAFPSIVLLLYFAKNKIKWGLLPLLVVGAIGLASVPNTFSHIGAPLYMSLTRTAISAIFGLVLGVAGTYAVHLIIKLYRRLRHE